MYIADHAREMVKTRGPRWAVIGSIRPGEAQAIYAVTGAEAEQIRGRWEDDGRYQIRVYPPDGTADLGKLAEQRRAAKAALDDVMQQLRAAVITAVEVDGRAEAEVARAAGVDRMTVRDWVGK